jgi:hypothetical protein
MKLWTRVAFFNFEILRFFLVKTCPLWEKILKLKMNNY